MRAVNLIPPQHRRGVLAGRGGEMVSYALIGGLAAVLVAVLAVVFTSNQVADRKSEVANLELEKQDAKEQADALQSFATFRTMQEARTATVASLARSRFDWERVINEVSRVIPSDVWLVKMAGTVVPGVTLDDSPALTTRESVTGPALEIVGCAPSQDAVAGFVSALEDVDGVTRVGVVSAEKSESEASAGGNEGGDVDDCRTKEFISKFEIVAAFDEVAVAAAATAAPAAPAPSTPPATTTPAPPESNSAQEQTQEAKQKVDAVTPGG